MRFFLLPKTFSGQPQIELTGKDANYLVNVLRLREGARIMGRDRDGNPWDLLILSKTKTSCVLSCTQAESITEATDTMPTFRPTCPIVLYQCLPKGRKTDEIVKRATEAGVSAVVLVQSRNCVASFEGKEDSKLSRYDAIVTEAVQQSGSSVPTKVEGVIAIDEICADFRKRMEAAGCSSPLGIVLHQSSLEGQDRTVISLMNDVHPDGVAIVVGPEGGLEESECSRLIEGGFHACVLRTNILRCETASIYTIGLVQSLLEEACV